MATDPRPAEPGLDAGSAALDEAVALAFRVLKGVMVVLVGLFLASGFFSVEPHEVAFIRRGGRLLPEKLEPGGHPALPLVDEVVRVDMSPRRVGTEAFDMPRTTEELRAGRLAPREGGLDPRREGALLTGGGDLVHVALAARYRVEDPRRALLAARRPEALVRVLLERAAVRAAAERDVAALLGPGREAFAQAVARRLDAALDDPRVAAGLNVEGVDRDRDLEAPPQVRAAFEAVSAASQERDSLRSAAQSEAARIESDARIAAARVRSRAAAEARRIQSEAETDAAAFRALAEERAGDPRGLERRLLAETLARALAELDEVFLVGEGGLRVRLRRDVTSRRRAVEADARRALGMDQGGEGKR